MIKLNYQTSYVLARYSTRCGECPAFHRSPIPATTNAVWRRCWPI